MGTDNLHHKRKARNTKKTRQELKSVLIALEDTKSSKYYFEELLKDKNLTGQVIFAKHCGTDPGNIINAIVKHKKENPRTMYEKEWAVFDRDDWGKNQINGAIQRARTLNICIGISNEAYELWVLLHFEKITKHTSRKELKHKLNIHFNKFYGQDYSKSSQDVYKLIIGFQPKAIKNSEYLVQNYINDMGKIDPENNNPLTLVYQLVQCLNSLYDKHHNCHCFPQDKL